MDPSMSLSDRPLASFMSLGFVALGLGACTFASPTHSTYNEAPDESDLTAASSSGASSSSAGTSSGGGAAPTTPAACEGAKLTKVDVSTLTACGDGKGHCYDKDKLPYLADELPACTGNDVCVPDKMLASGGDTPKACTSVLGAGGCASLLLTDLAKNQGSLTKDVCDDGEICAPCTDPTHDNAPTPFCSSFGVYDTACASEAGGGGGSGGTTPPPADTACCKHDDGSASGQCIADSAIPADQREDTDQLECSGGNKCVPAKFVAGNPTKCTVGLWDGVCLDQCFSSYLEYVQGALSEEECGATEACVPCSVLPDNTPGCQAD
jgi:hypothetical protein